MTDFTKFVQDALNDGMTPEALAKKFSETLNTEEKARNASQERLNFLQNLWEVGMNNTTIESAAAIVARCGALKHSDWTKADIENYYAILKKTFENLDGIYHVVIKSKNEVDMLTALMPFFEDVEKFIDANKSKEEGKAAPAGKAGVVCGWCNDDKVIKDFLRSI